MLWVALAVALGCAPGEFCEEVHVTPVGKSSVIMEFVFEMAHVTSVSDETHRLFPHEISHLLRTTSLRHFSVSLTRGRYERSWGLQRSPYSGQSPGASVWATFHNSSLTKTPDEFWKLLLGHLGGLLCASLSAIGQDAPIPTDPFAPGLEARHGFMPSETVCTENLTPWLKLLPCTHKAGMGALLDPLKLFTWPYHSLELEAASVCVNEECTMVVEQWRQSLTVLVPLTSSAMSVSNVLTARPLQLQSCPVAKHSNILIHNGAFANLDYDSGSINATLRCDKSGQACSQDTVVRDGVWTADLTHSSNPTDVQIAWRWPSAVQLPASVSVRAVRYHTSPSSSGTAHGRMHIVIHNTSPLQTHAWWTEDLPWFVRPMLHTLKLDSDALEHGASVREVHLQTAESHKHITRLMMVADIPANSVLHITYQFSKGFVQWTEHGPEPARGFDISPVPIFYTLSDSPEVFTIMTEPMLLLVPIPDFSMPFNALCIVSTVVTFFVGSILAIVTRFWDSYLERLEKRALEPSLPVKVLTWIKATAKPSKRQAEAKESNKQE